MRERENLREMDEGIYEESLLIVHCIEPIRSLPDTGSAVPGRQWIDLSTRYICTSHDSINTRNKSDVHAYKLYVHRTPKVAGTNAEAVAAVRTIAQRNFMVRFVL
jgi:hypothetical protein